MDWYHFFIFLYRASQHLSFGTGGRREWGAGNNWAGRGCGAWPPGAAEPKPRRGSTSAPPAIHTTGCGRARHPGQETAGIPTGRPPAGYSFPARPPPPATPRVLDAAQRRSGRSESPASAHLTCAACLIASSRACRYLVSPMAPPGCSMVSGIFPPEPGPSLGQTRGGQPSYGCRHSRTGIHLFIVLLLLACHCGAEKL